MQLILLFQNPTVSALSFNEALDPIGKFSVDDEARVHTGCMVSTMRITIKINNKLKSKYVKREFVNKCHPEQGTLFICIVLFVNKCRPNYGLYIKNYFI